MLSRMHRHISSKVAVVIKPTAYENFMKFMFHAFENYFGENLERDYVLTNLLRPS
jgi:hypothetical protein